MEPYALAARAIGVAVVVSALACTRGTRNAADVAPASLAPRELSGASTAASPVDRHVDPCDDFYDFACGPWRAAHPIPADHSRWDIVDEVLRDDDVRIRAIVDDALAAGRTGSPSQSRIAAVFAACADGPGIEARGLAPLEALLRRIRSARTREAVMDVVTDLQAHDVDVLFGLDVSPDAHDARAMMLSLSGGFVGMRPADYASVEPRSATLRAAYRDHLVRVFALLGSSLADASVEADRVISVETTLASGALTPAERRNSEARYKPMDLGELRARFPALDVPRVLSGLGAPVTRANVASLRWIEKTNELLGSNDLAGVRAYLEATVVHRFAEVLPRAFQEERFEFDQRVSRGVKAMAPRERRCLSVLRGTVGEDVGRTFLARYLPEASRVRMGSMIDAVKSGFERTLVASDWLSPSAKAAAREKLAKSIIVVGGSHRLRDLDGLVVTKDDLFGDAWRAYASAVSYQIHLLASPTDREEFFDSLPQSYDGFGVKTMNATGFTAGLLQPPLFDARADDALTFGGLGGIIGHELSHQFDDEGRKYDADGNLRPWWSGADVAAFEERAKCFVEEYGGFRTEEGTPLDGALTLGENLADNNGLRLAYEALHPSTEGPRIDGFSPAQRFFLGWGRVRCENATNEAQRSQALTNEHAAGRWRVNGVVSNMPEFASAFSCRSGARMAPQKRCRLW